MKNLLQIYGKYIAVTWIIIFLLLAGNLGALIYIMVHSHNLQNGLEVASGVGRFASELFAEGTAGEALTLTGEGEKILEENRFVFLFVLDEAGDVIFDWRCPEDFPDHYTVGEVASFSRWYLRDYPVKVWNSDYGLLVAGREKGSTWKMTMEYSEIFMRNLAFHLKVVLTVNLVIILTVIAYLGYRFYRSMKPLSRGIAMLSRSERVCLTERGSLSTLAAQLNRTSDILERQKAYLEQRDSARTEWIAGVSHDIRTPLAVIMGYADRLESEENLSGRGLAGTEAIKEQSLRIRKLIEDLNLTSKLAYHMQPLRVKPFHPAALLRELAAQILNEGNGEQYSLELSMDEAFEQIAVQGDEELLARAVGNLLHNSIRHNPQGCRIMLEGSVVPRNGSSDMHGQGNRKSGGDNPVQVSENVGKTVQYRGDGSRELRAREESDAPHIRIAVADTGAGIPREVVEALKTAAGGASREDTRENAGAAEQMGTDAQRESCAGRGQASPGTLNGATKPPHIMGLRIAAQIAEAHGGFLTITGDGHRVEIVV